LIVQYLFQFWYSWTEHGSFFVQNKA
jgi:hypothetical protein